MCHMIGSAIIALIPFSRVPESAPEHPGVLVNDPKLLDVTQFISYYTLGEKLQKLMTHMI